MTWYLCPPTPPRSWRHVSLLWTQPHGACKSAAEWMFISRLAHSPAESKSREPRCLHAQFEITEGRDGDRQRFHGGRGLWTDGQDLFSVKVMVDPEASDI